MLSFLTKQTKFFFSVFHCMIISDSIPLFVHTMENDTVLNFAKIYQDDLGSFLISGKSCP